MPPWHQVKLTKEDILKVTKGLKSSDSNSQFDQMFTKDLKLKKHVGKAQKSWSLVSVKGCRGATPEEKLDESKSAFMRLVSGKSSQSRFVFERQSLTLTRIKCFRFQCCFFRICLFKVNNICACTLYNTKQKNIQKQTNEKDLTMTSHILPIVCQLFVNGSSIRQWFVNGSSIRQ